MSGRAKRSAAALRRGPCPALSPRRRIGSAVLLALCIGATPFGIPPGALAQSDPKLARPDPARIEGGAQTYADYCSSCHGEELRNTSGGVTFDLRRLKPSEHSRFINSVLNGKNQMPPWRGALTEEQLESIWAYIRSINDR